MVLIRRMCGEGMVTVMLDTKKVQMLEDQGWCNLPDFGTGDKRELVKKIYEWVDKTNDQFPKDGGEPYLTIKSFYAKYGWYEHSTFQIMDCMGHSDLMRVVDVGEKGIERNEVE